MNSSAVYTQKLNDPVMEISLVNDRYTTKIQLPADAENMKNARQRLETSALDRWADDVHMSKKETPADYEAALKNCFDRWEYLKEYGGSDPTYSDGQGTPCSEK